MILVIGVIRMSAQSLTSEVGIGSSSHDLVDDFTKENLSKKVFWVGAL